jgi:hypothetical protein
VNKRELAKAGITIGEYANKPLLILKDNENDNFPFSFGPGKARKLLAAMTNLGPENFHLFLQEFCDS